MPDEHQAPRRSVVILSYAITAIVGLAGAEGVLWFGGYPDWWALDPSTGAASAEYRCDPQLGWAPREGRFDLVWGGLRDTAVRTTNWSDGSRSTAETEPPPDDPRPKAMFFGDSFMQGYGLSDDETLPWIVQRRHPELSVSNFAAGNYGTYQCYLAMRNHVTGPATVYYLFNAYQEPRNGADRSWLRVYQRPASGCFYPYAVENHGTLEPRKSEGNLVWFLSRHLRIAALVQDYTQMIPSWFRVRKERQTTEALLSAMNELVRSRGGSFTVILVDLTDEQRAYYHSFLTSKGIAQIDFQISALRDQRYRLPDGHPNHVMNELLAGRIEPLRIVTAR
jgi:hypothetical protein